MTHCRGVTYSTSAQSSQPKISLGRVRFRQPLVQTKANHLSRRCADSALQQGSCNCIDKIYLCVFLNLDAQTGEAVLNREIH